MDIQIELPKTYARRDGWLALAFAVISLVVVALTFTSIWDDRLSERRFPLLLAGVSVLMFGFGAATDVGGIGARRR